MHNNYYFFKHLLPDIRKLLKESYLFSCFSQNKDELVFRFVKSNESIFIRASLLPDFSVITFPGDFRRSRKNSIDLFKDVYKNEFRNVSLMKNDRSFTLDLENGWQFLFKMHGNRSNILLFRDGSFQDMFKKKMVEDRNLTPESLNREIDQSFDEFVKVSGNYKKLFPTFGKLVNDYLRQKDYTKKQIHEQWKLINTVINELDKKEFYIIRYKKNVNLSLINGIGEELEKFKDPIQVLNSYFIRFSREYYLNNEKNALLSKLKKAEKQTTNYLQKTSREINKIKDSETYRQIADIIMANIHNIPKNQKSVELHNFYTDEPVKISLKKELSPQRNAEIYYRKSKNQKIQKQKAEEALEKKKKELVKLKKQIDHINKINSLKELEDFAMRNNLISGKSEKDTKRKPYKKMHFMGYDILIGKNARSNDELLQKFTYKEDLWLHVKDARGSHVIVKFKPGNNFPRPVIEKAAHLAAYYSQKRSESLCPVIYTPRKYVRKRKGDPPGSAIVEKENVLLVEPAR